MKVCRVTSVPFVAFGHKPQFEYMAKNCDVDLTIVCSEGEYFDEVKSDSFKLVGINIEREISPLEDLKSVFYLYKFFKKNNFQITHSNTPKAGLVVAIAAFLARVPVRIHHYTGQRWVTLSGIKKWLLISADKLIGKLSTNCLSDSEGQAKFLIANNIIHPTKIEVIGKGSIAGVDLEKFNLNLRSFKDEIRSKQKIEADDIVITFLGRVVKDKGIVELVDSFEKLFNEFTKVKLLLVGPFEDKLDPLPSETKKKISNISNILSTGMVYDPEKYLAASDIFCLPSYREGFGTVVLEASALSLPVVATNIYGLSDAVEDGQTGLLVEVKNTEDLYEKLKYLVSTKNLRESLGAKGLDRVKKHFSCGHVTENLVKKYHEYCENKGI